MPIRRFMSLALLTLLPLGLAWPAPEAISEKPARPALQWKKTRIDSRFRSEGVAVADVNHDGRMDIIVGDVWYEAPTWNPHEIRQQGDYGDGRQSYSRCMACFADDLNGDGWPDVIVIGFPGAPCYWYENPGRASGRWREHLLWRTACNETPQYADLFGQGRRVLVMAIQPEGQLCWFAPGPDPNRPWLPHAISEPSRPGHPVPGTEQFSHGLGVGDINGDGRADVITTGGWWEQPAQGTGRSWKFFPAHLGEPCADMIVYDVNRDGRADVLSSSAHAYGIWWHEQRSDPKGAPSFLRHDLFPHFFSESHALQCVDINGDGLKDFVTGKRWWAHGPNGDIDPNDPAVLYWFEAQSSKDGVIGFTPHLIDDDSGIGTQFVVADVNGDGLPDVVISNKKGVFLFEQVRPNHSPDMAAPRP